VPDPIHASTKHGPPPCRQRQNSRVKVKVRLGVGPGPMCVDEREKVRKRFIQREYAKKATALE
jgi:tmRNA-binding protein